MTAVQNLTLYNIETELMELMTFRDSLFEDSELTPQERDESLAAIDDRIRKYVLAEVEKVDGIAYYLREFETRSEVYEIEMARLMKLKNIQDQRRKRLSDIVLGIMIQTNQPKLQGRLNTFELKKNPPSVDVVQPGLVPDNYQRLTVTMSPDTWNAVKKAVLRNEALVTLAAALMECKVSEPEIGKQKILTELKQPMQCGACEGVGVIEMRVADAYKIDKQCLACNGTGKITRGIPGCRLITDRKRLEVK